jgi:hypothetical protein
LNHCFHLLGGELAGSKREKEKEREEKKKRQEKKGEEQRRGQGSRQCSEWGILRDVLQLNFVGNPKLVQNPTANKPPRRRLCAGHMRKDGPEVFRARGSNKVCSLLPVFWTMQQDMADSLCLPTAVTTRENIRYLY